jgi:chemotaxis protein CheX
MTPLGNGAPIPPPAPAERVRVSLPAVLDSAAAANLADAFLAVRGQPVQVDAGGVTLLGGLCLQVLLSAGRTWESDRVPYALGPASQDFRDQSLLFGATLLADLEGTGT